MTSYARIAKLLDEPEPETRRLAAQQLSRLRGREAGKLLVRALGDDDWRVRKEAAAIASSIEGREYIVRSLASSLDDKGNVGLRNAAVEAMISLGSDAVPAAVEALHTLDADARKLAVEVLGGIPDLRGAQALATALRDEDANVRAAAAEALGQASLAGEEARQVAIEALTIALGADETLVRLASLDALTKLDARLSWRTVEPLAKDPILKRYALAAAAASDEIAAIEAVASATGDESLAVARDAIIALGQRVFADPDDEAIIEAASRTMRPSPRARTTVRAMAEREPDSHARGAALAALGLLRDQADVPLLVDALSDVSVAEQAEAGLKVFGEAALEPLVEAGRGASPEVRGVTLSMVPMIAAPEEEREVLAVMREALSDPSPDVLVAAARVLSRSGKSEDLRRIAPLLLHEDTRVATAMTAATFELARRHEGEARTMLIEIDAAGSEAAIACVLIAAIAGEVTSHDADLSFLQSALSNGDARARRAAVEALAAIGDARAADAVPFALADEEPEVVLAAVRALGKLRRADPLVALLASTREPSLIAGALRALGEADRDRAVAVAPPLMRSPDASIASAAIEGVSSLAGPARNDTLYIGLEHADTEVVKLALTELGRSIDARTLTRIGLALDHDARDVRRLAAELLGNAASTASRALLRGRLEREKDAVVRVAIATALASRSHEDR